MDDLDTQGVTFNSKMTLEKLLHSVCRSASERFGIFRISWLAIHDRLLFGSCFRGFVLPVLEYYSADTHLHYCTGLCIYSQWCLVFNQAYVFECLVHMCLSLIFFCVCSFLNSCGCSTAKSQTPPQETFFALLSVQSMGPNQL